MDEELIKVVQDYKVLKKDGQVNFSIEYDENQHLYQKTERSYNRSSTADLQSKFKLK